MCLYGLESHIGVLASLQFSMTNNEKCPYHARIWTPPIDNPTLEKDTVIHASSKVPGLNPRDPLACEAPDIESKPMRGPYSQSVQVSVPQDRIGGPAIQPWIPYCIGRQFML